MNAWGKKKKKSSFLSGRCVTAAVMRELTECTLFYSHWPATGEGAWGLCYSGQSLVQGGLRIGYEGGLPSSLSASEQER